MFCADENALDLCAFADGHGLATQHKQAVMSEADMETSSEAPKIKIKEQEEPSSASPTETATTTTKSEPPIGSTENEAVIAAAMPADITSTPIKNNTVSTTAKSATTTTTTTATGKLIKSVPASVPGAKENEEKTPVKKWPKDVMAKLKATLARRIKDAFYVRSLCKEMVRSLFFFWTTRDNDSQIFIR